QSPATQQISLTSTSATDLVSFNATFATSSGGNWLPVGAIISANTPFNILVPVTSSLLSAGSYTGTVTITASGPGGATVANSPLVIPVTLTVTSGSLTVAPTTLTFSQTLGGSAPAAQTVTLGSTPQALTYTATPSSNGNWLSVTPTSGTTSANPTLSVSVDGSKLAAGPYVGTITVVSPGAANSPATITVTLTVTPGTISAPTATLTFNQAAGGAAPAAQPINVTSTPGPVAFTVAVSTKSGGNDWLKATPASGNTPGTVAVSVSAGSLAVGVYNGTVTITSAATGSPISVPVTFNVLAAQTLVATPASLNFSYTLLLPAPQGQSLQVSAATAGTPFTVTTQVATGPAGWLVVTPASGNTTAALVVSIVTTGLTAGTFNGTVTIASPSAITPTVVPVTLTVSVVPIPVINAITNAASGSTGGLAPGEIVSVFGTGIGPATPAGLQVANGTVTSLTGNTRVLFDGVAAPVTFASAGQTNVIVPYGVANRTSTNVQVEFFGVLSAATSFSVVATSPGIFSLNQSGTGPGATVNLDGSINGPATPAPKGSVVSVFMTGEGQTSPIGTDGTVTPLDGSRLKKPILAVTATIGGVSVPATVLYAGSAPGLVSGAMQVNLQIPAGAPSGTAVPLAITVGNTSTQAGITIAVQ
ncbi:MAG TPA: hypothetical protein VKJ01_18610, partial [Candidatus Solibacter sp.]|nr:hypothetical protein [Candidatus Solibacter sp.]